MIAIQPEKGIRKKVVGHLAPAEVIDQRVPVAVEAQARILMFIKRGAVEAGQLMSVAGKVCRNPVDNDAEPFLMCPLDKTRKVLRTAMPAGRSEKPDGLVAPGA